MTQVRVLSAKAVVLTGVALLVIGVGLAIWFVLAYGGSDNQLEAIKTAGTFVVGGGGAAALYLTARRQRSNEMALQQKETDQEHADRTYALQERVAAATEAESLQRRITESYGAALEQLGSDKPAVRLGSLYALERLAQDAPAQRETIVNVICAYLRMAPETESAQEEDVRRTAQGLLLAHSSTQDSKRFWPDLKLDLAGAELTEFDLSERTVRALDCRGTTFHGVADFGTCTVEEHARFDSADFKGEAIFGACGFGWLTSFDNTRFRGNATFSFATFDDISFKRTTFEGDARFNKVRINRSADFLRARFDHPPSFMEPRFHNEPDFTGTLVRGGEIDHGWPPGWHAEPLGPDEETPEEPSGPWFRMVRRT